MGLPSTQRAAVKSGQGEATKVTVQDVPLPTLEPGQILVKLTHSGVCGTDKSLLYDEWAPLGPQATMAEAARGVAGHEGAGEVVALGEGVEAEGVWKVGDRAGVKWIAAVCGACEFCRNGTDECHCPQQVNSGRSTPGTFQQYVATSARYASRIPDGVADEEAGPIMCGGVTAYTACRRSAVRAGQWVVLLGAGGGLGHMGLQYAKALGMRVIAVDAGADKEKFCKELGAEHYIDIKAVEKAEVEVHKITTYGAHGVIVFAGSAAAYAVAPLMLRPGGTEVVVGIPHEATCLAGAPPAMIALRRLNIVGSVTGTLKDVEEALDFTARGLMKPRLTVVKLDELESVIKKMGDGTLLGRAVLKMD